MNTADNSTTGDMTGPHTAVVVADRSDRLTWRDTYDQSAGLRELDTELTTGHQHANDLLTDVFLSACQVDPWWRTCAEMAPPGWSTTRS